MKNKVVNLSKNFHGDIYINIEIYAWLQFIKIKAIGPLSLDLSCNSKAIWLLNSAEGKWWKRHFIFLFLKLDVCVCADPVLHQVSAENLGFSLMAYLSLQMYSLLHSCIPHVFMLFNIVLVLKGVEVKVVVVVMADSLSAAWSYCFSLLHQE